MTTNLDIIKRAMRKIHVLAAGTEPSSVLATQAMDNLGSLYVELIGQGSLGRLYDVLATSDHTALEWQRIRVDTAGTVITLPTTITAADANSWPYGGAGYPTPGYGGPDYGWWYGYGGIYPRPPIQMAPVVVVGSDYDIDGDTYTAETYWVYSAYKGAWALVSDLDQQDTFPLPQHMENGFAAMLAEYMVDDFAGGEVGKETKRQANLCRYALTNNNDSYRSSGGCASNFF